MIDERASAAWLAWRLNAGLRSQTLAVGE